MKIGFVLEIFYPERNGIITTTINLARNLIDKGHQVWFFVPESKGFAERIIENGIHIHYIKGIPVPLYKGMRIATEGYPSITEAVRDIGIDILHGCTPGFLGRTMNHVANMCDIPILATHHTLIDEPQYIKYVVRTDFLVSPASKIVWNEIYRPYFRKVWIATAPAEHTCQSLRDHFADLDVRFISNGIDMTKFEKNGEEYPIPSKIPSSWVGKKTFIYVGRLGFEKSVDQIFNAFPRVLESIPDAKLICIGGGPADEMLRGIIKEKKLEDSIVMTGLVPNEEIIGSGILNKCGAFVTASTTENQAMTVIEALCSGLPVVCADVPNMTAIVGEDMGWFFRGGDETDLADTMVKALSDGTMGEKAKNAFSSRCRFDGRLVADSFISVYKELLEKKASGWRPENWDSLVLE
ncbi:MAG: glycosyltransferase [Candidatus Ornithospirochaeta sp.]